MFDNFSQQYLNYMQMATSVKNFADDNNKLGFNLIGQKSE